MFINATVRPIALGIGAGILAGSALAVPSVMHDLDSRAHSDGLSSGWGRALAGFATNLALPAALLVSSMAVGRPGVRHGLQAAAAGVTMGWWGTKAFGDVGTDGMSEGRTGRRSWSS